MRVSVIIPLFNKAPYIERALASVASQTFTDFELIVIDDGSTDGGAAIVESFSDPRLRLIKQDNTGPGAARNRGLREAKGELVAFLDADDEWLPSYLGESVRLLDEQPEAAAVTSGYFAYPAGASTEVLWRSRGLTDGLVHVTPETKPSLVIALLPYMTPCTTVARARVLQRWGGFYQVNLCTHAEDAHLWLKVLLNESVVVNLKPLARLHFEASGPTQTRRAARPIEPFLIHPEEIEACCSPEFRELLSRVLAIRAFKTACMLGYWGQWRAARDLRQRFAVAQSWRLPKYVPAHVCSTPFGSALGTAWRALRQLRTGNLNQLTGNGSGLGTKRRAGKAGAEVSALYPERHPEFKRGIKRVRERMDQRAIFIDPETCPLKADPDHVAGRDGSFVLPGASGVVKM